MRRHLPLAAIVLALSLAAAPSAAAQEQTEPPGPCTSQSAQNQYPRGEGHDHKNIAIHRAACRVVQDAFLPLNEDLDDEVMGEMDVEAGIAAVAISYPQAGVLIFDVSDTANPRLLSRYESSECEGAAIDVDCGAFVDVSADGKLAFLSLQQISVVPGRIPPNPLAAEPSFPGVEVIDISDPESPQLAFPKPVVSQGGVHTARSHVIPDGPSSDDAPRAPGEYLFETANGFGVEVSRVERDPVRLEEVNRISIDEVHDMFLQDDPTTGRTYMYIAAGFSSGFYVYDVTDPTAEKLLGEWDITPQCTEDWYSHTIDVATRNGRRYVTMPAELFDNGAQPEEEQALGCGAVSGNGDKPGPMWIVDATDFSRLGQEGDSEATLLSKSEAALQATWTNAAGAPAGNIEHSPHNQQIVDDKIYMSNYHAGVTVLDASGAFAGRRERPKELGFYVPSGEPTRPIYEANAGPLIPFISNFIQFRPIVWDMVYYRGRVLAADETGGFYSLRYEEDQPLAPLPPPEPTPERVEVTPPPPVPGCSIREGFRSVRATPRGKGLRISFRRALRRKVNVDVFREASGRRIATRRVAFFRGRTRGFTWRPKRRLREGSYFVRFTMPLPRNKIDIRRVALQRRGGRFRVRPSFYRRQGCGVLAAFKLGRSVFGGRRNRPLGIAFVLNRRARVFIQVLRGRRVVKRFPPFEQGANLTPKRMRLSAKGLRRGDYRIRIQVVRPGQTVTQVLTARRL